MEFEENLARLAVQYAVGVEKGDLVVILGSTTAAELIRAIFVEVLKAGGHPVVHVELPGLDVLKVRYSSDKQLEFTDPQMNLLVEKADKLISISSTNNTKKMEKVDPEKIKINQTSPGMMKFRQIFMEREGKGELMWNIVPYPCEANAQEAGMDLYSYKDFISKALVLDKDPVAHWKAVEQEHIKLIKQLEQVDKIQVIGEDTDLTLSVKGRKWLNSCGHKNLPDGEVHTGPIEDSINGRIRFTFPGIYQGKEIENILLEFKDGKVVNATASKGGALLKTILEIPGADGVGEFAIGTNYAIKEFTKNMLFDEKMGGTMHMALGNGYTQSGSQSKSAIHWDILKDLKSRDSKIIADGKIIYEAGKWKI